MIVGVPNETAPRERRVAVTPDAVKKFEKLGLQVVVESGAGDSASYPDSTYEAAGARIVSGDEAFGADVVLKVACPLEAEIARYKPGALAVSLMDVFGRGPDIMRRMAAAKIDAIAMELIPRVTRAQAMDVLSSQANLAGYKAAIEAAHHFGRLIPMLMTAAGSVPQARVVVLGAGVAGLQAIATARRLGAQVEAYDVRPAVREEIMSLGARFLDIQLHESGAGEGGYARELTKDAQQLLIDALTEELPKRNIIISTAQIPGKPAPTLISEEAVRRMAPGSVIVDLAAGSGGNCPLSVADEVVERHGVTIVGHTDYPSRLAHHASLFLAKNMVNLLGLVAKKEDEKTTLSLDLEDDIISAALVTLGGEIRWEGARQAATEQVS